MSKTDFVVLALDSADADAWRLEHPELAHNVRVVLAEGRGWEAVRGMRLSALSLAPGAAADANIGGTEPPLFTRVNLRVQERYAARALAGVIAHGR
jgi:hypothetical protein